MKLLPSLEPILNEVTQRFGQRFEAVRVAHPNEIYFHAPMDLLSGFCADLYRKWNARLVSLFADDVRQEDGAFQVPVGPVPAGVIEPGHFLFSVAGEPVLYLQLRLFYTHKGTEKLFENLPVPHCVRLAESISGDSSFAHATAFCHAVERVAGVEALPRARALRTVCLELERIYNHAADLGAIATYVAFGVR